MINFYAYWVGDVSMFITRGRRGTGRVTITKVGKFGGVCVPALRHAGGVPPWLMSPLLFQG